jgi:hypothetical protein
VNSEFCIGIWSAEGNPDNLVGVCEKQNSRVVARGVFSLITFFGQAKKVMPSADKYLQ